MFPPFPGWQPGPTNEAVTQCMGAVGHDIAVFPVDEQRLLDQVHSEDARMNVLRAEGGGVTWLYGTERTRLGMVRAAPGEKRRYRRMLDADEIQYQVSGHRTLLTQRGVVELGPGDFVRIPLGLAHADLTREAGEYVSLLSHLELPQVAETARIAQPYTAENLAQFTEEVHA